MGLDFDRLVRERRPFGPLQREFYTEPEIFACDMARVFGRHWLYVAHACEIPRPGDWVTYEVGTDGIVVVRAEDGGINAFFNTCRHRGSQICLEKRGHSRQLTCPYHQWSYALDGTCLIDTRIDFGVENAGLSLQKAAVRDVEGLIFVSLSESPPSFGGAYDAIAPRLKPHGMDRAKLAHSIDYVVEANWKLVFENNRECFHCASNHKEYTRATYDVARDQAFYDPVRRAKLDVRIAEADARFRALGLGEADTSSSMTGQFFRANRTPLAAGFTTQSLDGQPVAPLMGDIRERDAGTLRITVFPNFWQHASDDHAVATRLTPLDPERTAAQVKWFVHQDAVEGRDYQLDRLLPLWQITSEQDWEICRNNQAGVRSSRYRPGPYSKSREHNVAHFVDWYIGEVTRA